MNIKTVFTGLLSASALLGVISLSSVEFDANSRNATSPESTDLTLTNQDFPLLTSNGEFNVKDSRVMTLSKPVIITRDSRLITLDDSVISNIRVGTLDSRLTT